MSMSAVNVRNQFHGKVKAIIEALSCPKSMSKRLPAS